MAIAVIPQNRRYDMKDKEEKKKDRTPEIDLPGIPESEIPDPPVPNRAHTEMILEGNIAPVNLDKDGILYR